MLTSAQNEPIDVYYIMAKPPDCSHCQKPATIHLTQIINNQIKKLDFCEGCPHQKGVTDPAGFSLTELLAQSEADLSSFRGDERSCPSCGFSPGDFKKRGRFGCPDCYESLEDYIKPMLEKMHRGTQHNGKVPEAMLSRVRALRRIVEAEMALRQAVDEEDYEEAARLRDELKILQSDDESGKFNFG